MLFIEVIEVAGQLSLQKLARIRAAYGQDAFVRQNAKESSVSHDESPWRNPDRHHSRPSVKYSVRQLPLRALLMRVPPERCSRYNAVLQLRSFCMVEQSELNRLFWQSRRGMLELDVLLVPFVKEVYPQLDEEDQRRYRKLLSCEDQDMFGWFMERAVPEDEDLRYMVRMILDRVQP